MAMHSYALTVRPLGGLTSGQVGIITNWLDKKVAHYAYSLEMEGDKRHMHAAVLTKSKGFHKNFRQFMIAQHRGEVAFQEKDKHAWSECKTWYQEEPDKDTWMKYLTKDGALSYTNLPANYNDFLAPNVPEDERRQRASMPQLHRFMELFEEHKLPSKSFDDVSCGITFLVFDKKVVGVPEFNKVKGFVMYLWMYLNNYHGCIFKLQNEFAETFKPNKKRKRGNDPHPASRGFAEHMLNTYCAPANSK